MNTQKRTLDDLKYKIISLTFRIGMFTNRIYRLPDKEYTIWEHITNHVLCDCVEQLDNIFERGKISIDIPTLR